MKKSILFVLLFVALLGLAAAEEPQQSDSAASRIITKSYELKHILPREARDILKPYYGNFSYSESQNLIVVTMLRENVAPFEELLKKIDVERPMLHFRIFTVIAANGGAPKPAIENAQLRSVLDELKKFLSFKFYYLDGVSLLSCKEGSHDSQIELSNTLSNLTFYLWDPLVENTKTNERTIKFRMDLRKTYRMEDGKMTSSSLIGTDSIAIKENGYLVAGVSKIGSNGDSLILVINVQIK